MQIVSNGDSLHEMSEPFSGENKQIISINLVSGTGIFFVKK